MTRVVLDTNALMMPVELDIRVFDELSRLLGSVELLVPKPVMAELRSLAASGGSVEARAARVGLDLARDRCREIKTEASTGDASIVELATREMIEFVVTNDRELRERVLASGIPVIGVRGSNTLTIMEP